MFLAFGELMLRLAPLDKRRLRQTLPGPLEATFAGAEANVCASLATWGAAARFVTALPAADNPVAEAALANLRGLGIDTQFVLRRAAGRLGIYFVETGANQRSSQVVYDRDGSAISQAEADEYRFEAALADVHWVHITGITPSLSEPAFRATKTLVQLARARGLSVSCDLNFRKKLWRWASGTPPAKLAAQCMGELLPMVDLLIANEEDAADVLDIHAAGSSVEQGTLDADAYATVARRIVERFPNVRHVAITLRESHSADHNNWGALLLDATGDRVCLAPTDASGKYRPYEIRDIVDRVGGGDAFGAGLLFALGTPELAEQSAALRYAVAASCLKHSILGDFNYVGKEEVLALMAGAASGRVRR
ncbi:MAG TPA: sugar kinase [Pirellulales bacterium]|jgi:2-dehydro-3-deoxygluconokinase|nr:sugar kinase [Pirellulales bacterium]